VTKFELTKFPSNRYTMMENHLFDALPKNGKKVNSADIVMMRRDMGDWDVKNPSKNITTVMQRLLEKIDENKEPFRIAKEGKYEGHHMVEYWLEERAPVRRKRKANGR
jgi:hypothetical protein